MPCGCQQIIYYHQYKQTQLNPFVFAINAQVTNLASQSWVEYIPRINRLHKLNWESQSQRATTSSAFIFFAHASTSACITTVRFQSSEKEGGVNVWNCSTGRLIFTCPVGFVLAHICCLMPHLCSKPEKRRTLDKWSSTVSFEIIPALFAVRSYTVLCDIWENTSYLSLLKIINKIIYCIISYFMILVSALFFL